PLPAAAGHPVGARAATAEEELVAAAERRSWRRHGLAVLLGTVVVALLALGLVAEVGSASADASKGSELRCNGFAELCGRRLDEVAFAGAHNAMSAASDPGWVF